MPNNPLLSIIIPVFNEEKYLSYCLDSLKKQTYKNSEIIVVDDGSTDKSKEIAKKFKVKIIEQFHQGPAVARNKGVSEAKGDILLFLDADIKYDKEYVNNLTKPIIGNKVIGTFNKDEYVANAENVWSQCWSINSDLPIGKRTVDKLPDQLPLFRAITKKAFESVDGFDSKAGYGEDITLSNKLGKLASAAPNAIAYHYNPESLLEVFYSARWIGRGEFFHRSIINLLRFSVCNSLRISLRKIILGAPIQFILFKVIYDFGMFIGVFLHTGDKSK